MPTDQTFVPTDENTAIPATQSTTTENTENTSPTMFGGGDNLPIQDLEPINEPVNFSEPAIEPIVDNIPVFETNSEPIINTEVENNEVISEDSASPTLDEAKIIQNNNTNGIISTFFALSEQVKTIFELSKAEEYFTLIGGKTANELINYDIYWIEDGGNKEIFIKKIITNLQDKSEDEHLLQFTYSPINKRLEILVDEEDLYSINEEEEKKERDTLLIKEKMEKFNFLFTDYLSELQKAEEEKKKADAKKHQLQEVFRNF